MAIKNIDIKNFRAFNGECSFKLAPITILTGTNSSGKSSLMKAMLLFKNMLNESCNENALKKFSSLSINDKLNLGNFNYWLNNKNEKDGNDEISFSFPFYFKNVLAQYNIEFTYKKNHSSIPAGELTKIRIFNLKTNKDILFLDNSLAFKFEIDELWNELIKFNKLRSDIVKLSKEIEKQSGNNGIQHALLAFLLGETKFDLLSETLSFDESEDISKPNKRVQRFELNDLLNSLNDDQRNDFQNIKGEFDSFPKDDFFVSNTILYLEEPYHPLIDTDFPLLVYDIINKPSTIEERNKIDYFEGVNKDSTNRLAIPLSEFLESGTKKKIKFSLKEKTQLKELQKIEINALRIAIECSLLNNMPKEEGSVIHLMNYALESITNFIKDINGNKDGYSIMPEEGIFEEAPFIRELLKNEDYPKSWLLLREKREGYCSKYDYKYNLRLFLDEIILGSINSNIENISSSFDKFENIPAYRNPMPNRYYSLKDENSFLSETLNTLTKKNNFFADLLSIELANKILKILGIADEIKLTPSEDGTIINVLLIKNGKEVNIADYGHGISQLVPIILKFASDFKYENKTYLIEEPETNLHPAYQSKLADMFVELTNEKNTSFVIETHSEYLIRKLQYLVAKGKLDPSDIKIYYFYHPDDIPTGQSQITKININENGVLSDDFGKGFFDEADNISIDIYNLLTNNRNN